MGNRKKIVNFLRRPLAEITLRRIPVRNSYITPDLRNFDKDGTSTLFCCLFCRQFARTPYSPAFALPTIKPLPERSGFSNYNAINATDLQIAPRAVIP